MSESAVPHRKVSWAELFFDLVFVFAVTEVSGLLHADHTIGGVIRALVVFIPIYWTWIGATIHANQHDTESPADRIAMFAVGLASLFMALAVPHAYDDRGLLYGMAYLVIRVILGAGMFRHGWFFFNSFTIGLFFTGPLLLLGVFLPGWWRVAVWAFAGVVDLAGPTLARRYLDNRPFEINHLPERFGLLVIVALGESIVTIGAQAAVADLGAASLVAVAAGFALTAGLWWVYFHFAADAIQHALDTAEVKGRIIRPVLTYGHLIFISGIIAVAVGIAEVVAHPGARLSPSVAALLCGGTVVYLAGFAFTRWVMFHSVARSRLLAAVAVLAVLGAGLALPGVVTLGLLAVVLALLNIMEYAYVRRSGQPIHLRRIPVQESAPAPEAEAGADITPA